MIKEIEDFHGYFVTDDGCVYSSNYKKTGKIKKLLPGKDGNGYLFVVIKNKNKKSPSPCSRSIYTEPRE